MAHVDIVINDVLRSITGGKGFAPGGSFGPSFGTLITSLDSGAEYRIGRQPERCRYELERSLLTAKNAGDVWPKFLSFFRQVGGAQKSFLLEDPGDFSTLPDGKTDPTTLEGATIAATWRPRLSPGALSGDTFQLVKIYGLFSEAPEVTRIICRPQSQKVVVAYDSTIQAEGVAYSVDYGTGIVTLLQDPEPGASVFAECLFHVPVRFDESTDQFLGAVAETGEAIASLPNLSMVEVLEFQHGTESRFFGGLESRSSPNSFSLSIRDRVTQVVTMEAPGLSVTLPDPNPSGVLDSDTLMTGGPYFVIYNEGAESFTVLSGLTPIAVLATGEWIQVCLQPALAGQRQWVGF